MMLCGQWVSFILSNRNDEVNNLNIKYDIARNIYVNKIRTTK